MMRPSLGRQTAFLRYLAREILLGTSQILRCPHFSINSAMRFCSFRDTEQTERRGGGREGVVWGCPPRCRGTRTPINRGSRIPPRSPSRAAPSTLGGQKRGTQRRKASDPPKRRSWHVYPPPPPPPPPEGLYHAKPMDMGGGNMGWRGRREGSTAVPSRRPPTPLPVSYLSPLFPHH